MLEPVTRDDLPLDAARRADEDATRANAAPL